jgi:flagellar hook assembly protein FlgD
MTEIRWQETTGKILLKICDVSGRLVRKLVNEIENADAYRVVWDGTDELGKKCPTGIYFANIENEASTHAAKIILVR